MLRAFDAAEALGYASDMSHLWSISVSFLAFSACSGSDAAPDSRENEPSLPRPAAAPDAPVSEILPLQGQAGSVAAPGSTGAGGERASTFVTFVDPGTGFETDAVYDADREVVFFDAALERMVSSNTGDGVSGWTTRGGELRWSSSGISFRVRFGTEDGERRAYFTEDGPGTICNLRISGPDRLFISGTNEVPPQP